MSSKSAPPRQAVINNKRARYDYAFDEELEAGIILSGTEVKSLRRGKASLNAAYAGVFQGEIWLYGLQIQEYEQAGKHLQHDPDRPKKLLLHKKEVSKLIGALQDKGNSLVPIKVYFNSKGIAKVLVGLGKGKKLHDKRQTIKDRDWKRQQERLMKG